MQTGPGVHDKTNSQIYKTALVPPACLPACLIRCIYKSPRLQHPTTHSSGRLLTEAFPQPSHPALDQVMAMIPSDWFPGRRRTDAFDPFSTDLWDPIQDYFPSTLSFPRSGGSDLSSDTARFASARVDWRETPEAHIFQAELPGLRKEEVKVEMEEGGVLQISGERVRDQEEKTDTWHRMERSSGRFVRRFRLPDDAKFDRVKASMDHGVLTVTVPKTPGRKPEVKTIDIA